MAAAIVPLFRLDSEGEGRLWGRHVRVRNAGVVNEPGEPGEPARPVPVGDARPDAEGHFLFEPGRGGGRIDKVAVAEPDFRWRYLQAAHFGEVNTYFHVDRIAAYAHDLLRELKAPPLPCVTAVVNAHHASVDRGGARDGLRRDGRWVPFQGGHYRLPSRRYDVCEHEPLSADGEIHLGPGRELLEHGALVEAAGGRYRANASHNAGIIYHEYGHHVTRHTADFRANSLRRPDRQDNRKTALDEGSCDYWAAALLDVPHVWAWHRRHDGHEVHPRSLTSPRTMANFQRGPGADTHANGTIWATALWGVRTRLARGGPDGARRADLLVLQALLLIGRLFGPNGETDASGARRARAGFEVGLAALLRADEMLYEGRHRRTLLATFAARGIRPAQDKVAREGGRA